MIILTGTRDHKHLQGFKNVKIPLVKNYEKKWKMVYASMKWILYNMGPLTLVRLILQRAFEFEPPFEPGSKLNRVLYSKFVKKKKCLKRIMIRQKLSPCFHCFIMKKVRPKVCWWAFYSRLCPRQTHLVIFFLYLLWWLLQGEKIWMKRYYWTLNKKYLLKISHFIHSHFNISVFHIINHRCTVLEFWFILIDLQ